MKNKIIRFLNLMACFFSGAILNSLWIMESTTWQYYLPLCLACIALSNMLREE